MEKDVNPDETGLFGYRQNIFRFNFAGISFTQPAGVEYKYRLENIDKNWRATKDRSLFYPFLPPGTYTLNIKAVNSDGFESQHAARYTFKIRPPFWQTWWFSGIILLIVGGFLFLVFRWRVKRTGEKAEIKARKAELEAKNRQLVMSQRMELMGTLAAGTVHDLKNLMAVIIGYSQVMEQKYRDDSDAHRNIEIIKDTASTAVQMSKQILSFAGSAGSKNHFEHGAVELRELLAEILDTLKITHFKAVQVQLETPVEPVYFSIHPARFQQLVMNLCLNACHAMPTGGTLRISLSRSADNQVTLEIADNGIGIDHQDLDKIFEPLFTTKGQGKGTGLGLFVVKQIVDENNGQIEVRSETGTGTTFIIRFPPQQD
jgi:signal transduction histidine kinase